MMRPRLPLQHDGLMQYAALYAFAACCCCWGYFRVVSVRGFTVIVESDQQATDAHECITTLMPAVAAAAAVAVAPALGMVRAFMVIVVPDQQAQDQQAQHAQPINQMDAPFEWKGEQQVAAAFVAVQHSSTMWCTHFEGALLPVCLQPFNWCSLQPCIETCGIGHQQAQASRKWSSPGLLPTPSTTVPVMCAGTPAEWRVPKEMLTDCRALEQREMLVTLTVQQQDCSVLSTASCSLLSSKPASCTHCIAARWHGFRLVSCMAFGW